MALEARGVRVAALRRETAAIIASEIPTAASNGSAAGTDDLMQVLLDQRAEFPTSELLARFTSRVALRDGHDPLPPLTRSGTDLRYVASPAFRHGPESPRGYRGDFTASPTDAIQNSRIEALEQMVRALNQELSNERHAALLEARGTNSHEPLVSKLESIEAALEFRAGDVSVVVCALAKAAGEGRFGRRSNDRGYPRSDRSEAHIQPPRHYRRNFAVMLNSPNASASSKAKSRGLWRRQMMVTG